LVDQIRSPDEVLIVLKPSGDGSEEVIRSFEDKLPIRVIYQSSGGNFVDAVELGIKNAKGDIVLFLDDDAIAPGDWISKYEELFNKLNDAGGISGVGKYAYLKGNEVILTQEQRPETYSIKTTNWFHRKPLPEYTDYCEWIAISGLLGGGGNKCHGDIIKTAGLWGANMGFRRNLLLDCPVSSLYRHSKKGLHYESVLAYCVRRKGYHTYKALNLFVWHIQNIGSLTKGHGFWHYFWIYYDKVDNYWRYKKLGAKVSLTAYLIIPIAYLIELLMRQKGNLRN